MTATCPTPPCCSLFPFYIEPQLLTAIRTMAHSCSLFPFYIEPQLASVVIGSLTVVPYSLSTSNHNYSDWKVTLAVVVPYSLSTSNHNYFCITFVRHWLFLIPFLHRTTTWCAERCQSRRCSLFPFYIEPQPWMPCV